MISNWLTCSNCIENVYPFTAKFFDEAHEPSDDIQSNISSNLAAAYINPQMAKAELQILLESATNIDLDIIRNYVECEILPDKNKVATWVGNFGEILTASLLIEIEGFGFPIYKLRYREKRNWAMRMTDLFLIKMSDSEIPLLCFGEVKTRSSSCNKDIGIEGHRSLATDDSLNDSPEMLNFVCRMLFEKEDYEQAQIMSKIRLGKQPHNRRYDLFLIHELDSWNDEIVERLANHDIDERLSNFSLNVVKIKNLRILIESCYAKIHDRIEELINE